MNKVNHEIRAQVVKVVGLTENGLKEMKLSEAIKLAEESGEDVIQISYSDGVPIVRIEDYSKFVYKEKKRQKELAKKQRENNLAFKEIRMLYTIEENDLNIKIKNIDRLISEGNRVKISIIYKGRAVRMISSGIGKMQDIENKLQTKHKIDNNIKIEGNRVVMTVVPCK